jgi:hypothetical protein
MNHELTSFLTRNHASREVLSRLAATGAATPEETWARANARDLVWAVTRPGVMSDDQRRRFLSEAVLAPIEHLLTDERSKNILQKLRTNEPITAADRWAASQAAEAAADEYASWAASWAAADAASWAAASWAAASQAAAAVAKAEDADAAAERAVDAASLAAEDADASWASWAAAREAQARWLRNNFVLTDLNIK